MEVHNKDITFYITNIVQTKDNKSETLQAVVEQNASTKKCKKNIKEYTTLFQTQRQNRIKW